GHEASIDAMLKEDEAVPQLERRSVAAIFRVLRDEYGYSGGCSAVYRYCRSVQVPFITVDVRPVGDAEKIESLTIARQTRIYQLIKEPSGESGRFDLRLHRDRRLERKTEVARWIDQLRAGRLPLPPRGDPRSVERLLRCVNGTG